MMLSAYTCLAWDHPPLVLHLAPYKTELRPKGIFMGDPQAFTYIRSGLEYLTG